MRIFMTGLLVAGSLAILSGCGSSSSKLSASAFSAAANKICTNVNTQAKAVGSGTSTANATNAALLNKLIAISNKGVTKLKALSGPNALQSARDTFVTQVDKNAAEAAKAAAAAKAGNQSAYVADAKALAPGDQQSNIDGSKLGAPACATDS